MSTLIFGNWDPPGAWRPTGKAGPDRVNEETHAQVFL